MRTLIRKLYRFFSFGQTRPHLERQHILCACLCGWQGVPTQVDVHHPELLKKVTLESTILVVGH